jgi:hypothetical protein
LLASKLLGIRDTKAVIFQDNQSTIKLAETGKSKTGNSKHIDARYFYIKEKLEQGTMELKSYLPVI